VTAEWLLFIRKSSRRPSNPEGLLDCVTGTFLGGMMRSNRIVEHRSTGDRTRDRTRMNGDPCHPGHAVSYQVSQH
jgi:hypothetical protein